MIQSITFAAEQPGPRLLILGAVHGNETCGTVAIRRICAEIEKGILKLVRGCVTFVPVCNPCAFVQGVRFTERNLNRYLVPMEPPDTYEAKIGNVLCPLLAACDVLLDIHSYTVGGPPFVFVGSPQDYAFASSLGAGTLMTGWEAAYAASGGKPSAQHPEESTGTTEYARRFGAMGCTIECGQHQDPAAPDVAYRAIRGAFAYLGFTEDPVPVPSSPVRLITVTKVFYRGAEGALAKDWKHLDSVARGDLMATGIRAPVDGFIIMPKLSAKDGEEWFYFGVGSGDVMTPTLRAATPSVAPYPSAPNAASPGTGLR